MNAQPLLEATLANLAVASALALCARVAARGGRAPAVAHGLWLLALLKLVTPPLFRLPIPLPQPDAVRSSNGSAPATIDVPPWAAPSLPPLAATSHEQPAPAVERAPSTTAIEPARPVPWRTVLAAVWAVGALLAFALAAQRIRIVQRLVRLSARAPRSLEREACSIARCLGLARVPEIRLVPARLAPMLWAPVRRALIVLPEELVARLDSPARAALLAHELAHYRRRDHLVRWLELFVRGLHWWNPLARYCARGLRAAEEACCDAWVVWALPGRERAYAGALLEAADFLNGAPEPMPLCASALSPARELERRLTMILRADAAKSLTRRGRLGLLAVGAAALPFLPAFSQGEGTPAQDDAKRELHQRLEEIELRRVELEAKVHELELERRGFLPAHSQATKLDQVIETLRGELAPIYGDRRALHALVGELEELPDSLLASEFVSLPAGPLLQSGPWLELRRNALKLGAEALAERGLAEECRALLELAAELEQPGATPPPASPYGQRSEPDRWRVVRFRSFGGGGAGPRKGYWQGQPSPYPPRSDAPSPRFETTPPANGPGGPPSDDRFERLERRVEELTRLVEQLVGDPSTRSSER